MANPEIPLDVLRLAEAFVFASPKPVTWEALRRLLPDHLDPTAVLFALQERCASRGVTLVEDNHGWVFRTAPDLAEKLREALRETRRLPRAAMECLVIIAYNQPITRAEIEEVRGVGLAQNTMDLLLETGLIRPIGRKEAQGRPTIWGTTPRFLSQFGLADLRQLPGASSLAPFGIAPVPKGLLDDFEEPFGAS